ncbi:BRCA1-associated RING domain protein 1-like isoform X1 [Hyposmocoma kahamanoa]|uniref:BRCA1-associated RING domain protein 1-like isoform X1 n=1 Tax=Hyposmocoma kahamanoa TaxID=1477025 RepID=UPI000E6D7BEA|nr:BRCA1-associated RING domain protein 1-like isoform X1 [Hyposmocoma kahamanoa]
MSSVDLSNFLKALEAVKQDYTCPVCKELCKDPVTLSKCFHIVCRAHFEGLKVCPSCNIDLEGCNMTYDDRLGPCIDSTRQLDTMFEKYKFEITRDENFVPSASKRSKLKNDNEKPDDPSSKQDILVELRKKSAQKEVNKAAPLKEASNNRRKRKGTPVEKCKAKSNEVAKKQDVESRTRSENIDMSFTSNTSLKTNKIEKRNNKGETVLHVSCRLGKIDKVTELLNQGANTNTKDNAGWTPLHEVVQNGRLDLVKLLLQFNTLINVPGQGNETPLHEAVRYGHLEIAEELVKNGADVNAKNVKGETPLQLASDKMKYVLEQAAENIIQTQGINVTIMSEMHIEHDYEDIRIYSISQKNSTLNSLKTLAKAHSNLHIEAKFNKKVTHLLVDADRDGVCQTSNEVLQAIVSSLWIISSDWIEKSTAEKLEPFDKYEVTGVGTTTYKGPKNSRYNKYKQHPGIFDGCHFYFHNFNIKYEVSKTVVLTKQILTKLVTDAGGVVLRRVPNPESIPDSEKLVPYHAKKDGKLVNCSHYIIFKDLYEPMYNMQHLKALPIGWLIECIEKYELCEPW